MATKDRTLEFRSTIDSKRGKPQFIQQKTAADAEQSAARWCENHSLAKDTSYRNFMKLSRDCARILKESYEKLEKLVALIKKTDVFEDGEVNKLTAEIKKDISDLKRRVDDLTARQQPKQLHSKNIVTSLQQRLADMSISFKSTLEVRSKNVQQQKARHELYAGAKPTSTLHQRKPHSLQQAYNNSHQIPHNYSASNNRMTINMGHDNDYNLDQMQQGSQAAMPYQQQQAQLQILHNDDTYMNSRVDSMQTIETTIVELGAIFNQLATMVQAQDEQITRIDTNITDTAINVEAAHEALLQYFSSISSNRWLILKVFGILFLFFVLFVIFGT